MVGKIEQQRNFALIKAMNEVVMAMNDEDAIEPWFYAYPDGADDEEIMDMAGDAEMMHDIASNFRCRMAQGAKSGWCTLPYFDPDEFGGYVYGAEV